MDSNEIKALQTKLRTAGLYTGKIDGKMGPQTKTALGEYNASGAAEAEREAAKAQRELDASKAATQQAAAKAKLAEALERGEAAKHKRSQDNKSWGNLAKEYGPYAVGLAGGGAAAFKALKNIRSGRTSDIRQFQTMGKDAKNLLKAHGGRAKPSRAAKAKIRATIEEAYRRGGRSAPTSSADVAGGLFRAPAAKGAVVPGVAAAEYGVTKGAQQLTDDEQSIEMLEMASRLGQGATLGSGAIMAKGLMGLPQPSSASLRDVGALAHSQMQAAPPSVKQRLLQAVTGKPMAGLMGGAMIGEMAGRALAPTPAEAAPQEQALAQEQAGNVGMGAGAAASLHPAVRALASRLAAPVAVGSIMADKVQQGIETPDPSGGWNPTGDGLLVNALANWLRKPSVGQPPK